MKKLLKLIMLLITCFILSSCKSKEEYKLIEITGEDLVTNINNNNNFIFAFVNTSKDNYQSFMDSLELVVKNAHLNIYYVDYNHMDYNSFAAMVDTVDLPYNTQSYVVYKNKEYVVSDSYTNYQKLYLALKNYTFTNKLTLKSEDDLKKDLDLAKEELENGNIGLSYYYLNKSWTLKETKEFEASQNIYKILNLWENYEFRNPEKLDYTTYHSMFLSNHTKYIMESTKSGEYNNFEKPTDLDDYSFVYYYIKDDIIYTAKEENTDLSKYKATYKINSLSDDILNVTKLSNNKEYEYIRGV